MMCVDRFTLTILILFNVVVLLLGLNDMVSDEKCFSLPEVKIYLTSDLGQIAE